MGSTFAARAVGIHVTDLGAEIDQRREPAHRQARGLGQVFQVQRSAVTIDTDAGTRALIGNLAP